MKRFFIILLIVQAGIQVSAQQMRITYNPVKDHIWLDSINRIIHRNDPKYNGASITWNSGYRYIDNSVILGLYYERLYNRGILKNMNKALYYYKKVDDLGKFEEDEKGMMASAKRGNVWRKLEDIYYKGTGVKRDRQLSYSYALRGIVNKTGLFKFYSNRYFHHANIILPDKKDYDFTKESSFSFWYNPFAARVNISEFSSLQPFLEKIARAFIQLNTENHLEIVVTTYSEPSIRSSALALRTLDNINNYFVGHKEINQDIVITNNEYGRDNHNFGNILFQKKSTF